MVNVDDRGKCAKSVISAAEQTIRGEDVLAVKVLGAGCANCQILAKNTAAALVQLGMELPVEKVADYSEIASYGVMSTPALVIGRKVVSVGKVLSVEEIVHIISKQKG